MAHSLKKLNYVKVLKPECSWQVLSGVALLYRDLFIDLDPQDILVRVLAGCESCRCSNNEPCFWQLCLFWACDHILPWNGFLHIRMCCWPTLMCLLPACGKQCVRQPGPFVGLRPGRPHSLHTTEQKTVGAGKLLDDLVHRLWLEPERLDAVLVARTPAKLVAALKSLPRMKGVLRFEHALDYFILCEKDAGHRLFQVPLTKRAVDWAINGGAAEGLKPGYCLTSLSEATRKLLDKPPTDGHRRPESCQKRRQGRCGAFESRLLPNVAFWSH